VTEVLAEVLAEVERARAIAGSVPDPELPMVTIADLGILRDVTVTDGGVEVALTPTYLGCPALAEMCRQVSARLTAAGFAEVRVRTVLAPPWSSDDITPDGRQKLAAAGIAPPQPAPKGPVPLTLGAPHRRVACPRCGADDTAQTSAFGATACTALYRCAVCREPFEYVKEIRG
jgi:ring-1,2-phenylacetyl-CoA epoxidase subunit PaaD